MKQFREELKVTSRATEDHISEMDEVIQSLGQRQKAKVPTRNAVSHGILEAQQVEELKSQFLDEEND